MTDFMVQIENYTTKIKAIEKVLNGKKKISAKKRNALLKDVEA